MYNSIKHAAGLKRASELKTRIQEYLDIEKTIETGFRMKERNRINKERILEYFQAKESDWNRWSWQMKHRISDVETLRSLPLSNREIEEIRQIFRNSVGPFPYYLSLIDPEITKLAIFKQAFDIKKLQDHSGHEDPMAEADTSPAPTITDDTGP